MCLHPLTLKTNLRPAHWLAPVSPCTHGNSLCQVGISVPVRQGKPTVKALPGTARHARSRSRLTDPSANFDLELREQRFGARYRHLSGQTEIWDLELNIVYEGWSSRYDAKLTGAVELSVPRELNDVTIEKGWQDMVSFRLGGTWNAIIIPSVFQRAASLSHRLPEREHAS